MVLLVILVLTPTPNPKQPTMYPTTHRTYRLSNIQTIEQPPRRSLAAYRYTIKKVRRNEEHNQHTVSEHIAESGWEVAQTCCISQSTKYGKTVASDCNSVSVSVTAPKLT